MHDHYMTAAEPLQHARLNADQIGMEHAHHLVFRAGGVGERAQDVEQGAHTEFLAHRRRVFHRAVVIGREHETDTDFPDRSRDLLRLQVDVDAERLQHVSAARLARYRASAVLRDRSTRRSRDERRGGRDVEAVRGIASRAAGIDQHIVSHDRNVGREFAHDLRRGSNLADRFLLHAQAGDDRRDQHR